VTKIETLSEIYKFHNKKDYLIAKNKYKNFIQKNQTSSEAYYLLGMLYQEFEKNLPKALSNLTKAINYNPKNYEAYLSRGNIYASEGKFKECIYDYTEALKINNGYSIPYNNRGKIYADLGEYEKAISDFSNAISIDINFAAAYLGRANSKAKIQEFEGAIKDYISAISKKKNNYDAFFGLSIIFLLLGNYKEGFKLYESRWNLNQIPYDPPDKNKKIWLGEEDLNGKKILIRHEQGLGDTIQFSRYVEKFKNFNCEVFLEVQKPLVNFISTIGENIKVFQSGSFKEDYDYHCPIMSLPLAFKTTKETIPSKNRYLKCDPIKITKWSKILGKKSKPRIGLAWSGSKDNPLDKFRSIKLEHFAQSLNEKYEWISLHKEYRDNEKTQLSNFGIKDFSDYQLDFSETAAQIENLDLIISVDTSIAHCAGAIGKKTIILISYSPDWRWLLNTNKSPWYPSVELIRLQRRQKWQDVFLKLIKQIDNYF